MKHNVFHKLISVMLVLAMLVGTLAVLSFGTAAEDTDTDTAVVTNPALADVDELRVVTPNYQSNWAGSTIENKYGVYSVATDGQYNGAMQWVTEGAATLSEDGVLSFDATGNGNPYLSFRPEQNFNIKAGPTRIAFDVYYDEHTPVFFYEGERAGFFYVDADGKVYFDDNKWYVNTFVTPEIDTGFTMTEGWNTIEMIFVPELADGTISTNAGDTIASNQFYLRIIPEGTESEPTMYKPSQLNNNFFHAALLSEDWRHYANGISASCIKYHAETDGILKIRNARAMNLSMYIKPASSGYGLNETRYEPDWRGATYSGGWPTSVSGDGAFSWYNQDACIVNSNVTINADGEINFKNLSSNKYSYVTMELHPQKATKYGIGIGPIRYKMDFYWSDPATNTDYNFPGLELRFALSTTSGSSTGTEILTVATTGAVTSGSTSIGQMKEGWNTVEMIFVPRDTDGEICLTSDATISYTDYFVRTYAYDDELDIENNGFKSLKISDMNTLGFKHKTTNITNHFGDTSYAIRFFTKTGTGNFTVRKFSVANITPDVGLNQINVKTASNEKTVYMPADYVDKTLALPTVAGADKWIAVANSGVTSVKASGDLINANTDYSIVGAEVDASKFKGASMSLGGEMAINMKVDSAALSAESPDGLVALVDGTALQGMSDGEKDDKGLYTIAINGILARDMAEELSIYLVTIVGEKYYISENPQAYSPLIYAQRMYAKSETKVQELLKDMLGYGAAAEKNIYGTNVIAEAAAALGITSFDTTLPTNYYDDSLMTDTDIATIAGIADIGATLTNGISLYFEEAKNEDGTPKAAFDTLVVTLLGGTNEISQTYTKDSEGKIVMDDIMPYCINAQYRLTFMNGETVVGTANVTVGEYLTLRMNNYPEEADLITATIIYMVQVKEYADVR